MEDGSYQKPVSLPSRRISMKEGLFQRYSRAKGREGKQVVFLLNNTLKVKKEKMYIIQGECY